MSQYFSVTVRVDLKLGFHALLKVCPDRDDTAPLILAFSSYLTVNTHFGGRLEVCIWKSNKQTKPIH